jgi:hypothetical protein
MWMKELFIYFKMKENGFKVSYGKVQNYCTLHTKTTDSNKKHTKKAEQLCYTSSRKNYGFLVKAH